MREKFIGLPTSATLPASAWGSSMRMPRWRIWGSAKTWSMVLIGPAGTPTASSASSHWAAGRAVKASARRGIRVSRWRTRPAFLAKRWSMARSSRPKTRHSRANWASLPTATMMWPSAVANTW